MYAQKSLLIPEDLEAFSLIEDLLQCGICKEIFNSPVQCSICDNVFCEKCFEEYVNSKSECLFKCKNPQGTPCCVAKTLLDNFSFKCKNKCVSIMKYSALEDHYIKNCPYKNYPEAIKAILVKIGKIKQENAMLKDQAVFKNQTPFHNKTSKHIHPLMFLATSRAGWNCDVCRNPFMGKHKSYYCTLCDYDLCPSCFAQEGVLH